jgi:hypothetical protein
MILDIPQMPSRVPGSVEQHHPRHLGSEPSRRVPYVRLVLLPDTHLPLAFGTTARCPTRQSEQVVATHYHLMQDHAHPADRQHEPHRFAPGSGGRQWPTDQIGDKRN